MNPEIMKRAGFKKEVERVEMGLCPICGIKIETGSFRNEISKKEFKISGMCQKCQDDIFGAD